MPWCLSALMHWVIIKSNNRILSIWLLSITLRTQFPAVCLCRHVCALYISDLQCEIDLSLVSTLPCQVFFTLVFAKSRCMTEADPGYKHSCQYTSNILVSADMQRLMPLCTHYHGTGCLCHFCTHCCLDPISIQHVYNYMVLWFRKSTLFAVAVISVEHFNSA